MKRVILPAVFLLLAAMPAAAAEDRLDVTVTPHVAVPEPGIVRVTALVGRDSRNRRLTIEIESIDVYRKSERPLNGARAVRRHSLVLGALPAGTYEIRVHLEGTDGEITEVRYFRVRGDSGEP